MIVSIDNVLVVEHNECMTLYSPSVILDAFKCTKASCMVFMRNMFLVDFKGVYKASSIDARDLIPYSMLSPAVRLIFRARGPPLTTYHLQAQDQIVEMTVRIEKPSESERAIRNGYATGARTLRALKLDYVCWDVDVQLGLDMFTRAAVVGRARVPDRTEASPSTPAHLLSGLRIADDALCTTAAPQARRRARVGTSTLAAAALPPKARARPLKVRAPAAAAKAKGKDV